MSCTQICGIYAYRGMYINWLQCFHLVVVLRLHDRLVKNHNKSFTTAKYPSKYHRIIQRRFSAAFREQRAAAPRIFLTKKAHYHLLLMLMYKKQFRTNLTFDYLSFAESFLSSLCETEMHHSWTAAIMKQMQSAFIIFISDVAIEPGKTGDWLRRQFEIAASVTYSCVPNALDCWDNFVYFMFRLTRYLPHR